MHFEVCPLHPITIISVKWSTSRSQKLPYCNYYWHQICWIHVPQLMNDASPSTAPSSSNLCSHLNLVPLNRQSSKGKEESKEKGNSHTTPPPLASLWKFQCIFLYIYSLINVHHPCTMEEELFLLKLKEGIKWLEKLFLSVYWTKRHILLATMGIYKGRFIQDASLQKVNSCFHLLVWFLHIVQS